MHDVEEVIVRDLEIYVDVFEQLKIYRTFNALDEASGLPIFPLNTGRQCRTCSGRACHPGEILLVFLVGLVCLGGRWLRHRGTKHLRRERDHHQLRRHGVCEATGRRPEQGPVRVRVPVLGS